MSQISDFIRKMFKEGDDIRDAGLTTPADIVRYDDICYGSDAQWQVLDVYRPAAAAGQTIPVLISVHGGGWVYGDKERYQFYCMNLAQHGFAVVNYTYRLTPEFQYPSSVEDTNLVAACIMDHAAEYGLDTDHIFAVGDSAGGHLLSLYAAICTNPDYAEKYAFQVPEGFALKAIALNCGVYDLRDPENLDQDTIPIMQDLLPGGVTEENLALVSSALYVTENYPPVFYMTCTGDFLKAQAPLLSEKLLEKNIPHEFHYFGSSRKELGHVFHLNIRSEDAKACNDLECAFFQRFLQD